MPTWLLDYYTCIRNLHCPEQAPTYGTGLLLARDTGLKSTNRVSVDDSSSREMLIASLLFW